MSAVLKKSSGEHVRVMYTHLPPLLHGKNGVYRDIHYLFYFCSETLIVGTCLT